MIEWPIYRNFSVFSQNSGYFDQNEKGVKKCPFPQSLRFCHNWWASGGVPGVRYAEKLSALFYLHWESLWPGVGGGRGLQPLDVVHPGVAHTEAECEAGQEEEEAHVTKCHECHAREIGVD